MTTAEIRGKSNTMPIIHEEQPENWKGLHVLKCLHQLNSRAEIHYLMYCDVIKPMPNARLKLRVYGCRYHSIKGERIRYVDAVKVRLAERYGITKETHE